MALVALKRMIAVMIRIRVLVMVSLYEILVLCVYLTRT